MFSFLYKIKPPPNEFAELRAFRAHVPYAPTCLKLLRAYVPTCPHFSRAYVPSCLKLFCAYMRPFFTCLRAYNHSQNILRLTSIPRIVAFLWII